MSEVFQMKTTKAPHIAGHSSVSETPFLKKKQTPKKKKKTNRRREGEVPKYFKSNFWLTLSLSVSPSHTELKLIWQSSCSLSSYSAELLMVMSEVLLGVVVIFLARFLTDMIIVKCLSVLTSRLKIKTFKNVI